MVIAYRREGGLGGDDRRIIEADRLAFNRGPPAETSPLTGPVLSRAGSAALMQATVTFSGDD